MVRLPFWKMHGAGNDFMLFDDRQGRFPAHARDWMAAVARRRTGVGCDGVILIQPSATRDFRMRFFNPDGAEVAMCGNGARCVARLARDLGAAGDTVRIETTAGTLRADVSDGEVTVYMTQAAVRRPSAVLEVEGRALRYTLVDTGVPHAVLRAGEVSFTKNPVGVVGPAVRYHPDFAPDGTNVNFVTEIDGHTIAVRTYERGVEAETLACGTGVTACAVAAVLWNAASPPIRVHTAGGDVLTVTFRSGPDGFADVRLTGPAVYVYRGELEYEDCDV